MSNLLWVESGLLIDAYSGISHENFTKIGKKATLREIEDRFFEVAASNVGTLKHLLNDFEEIARVTLADAGLHPNPTLDELAQIETEFNTSVGNAKWTLVFLELLKMRLADQHDPENLAMLACFLGMGATELFLTDTKNDAIYRKTMLQFASEGGKAKSRIDAIIHAEWQRRTNKILEKNQDLSISAVAKIIEKQDKEKDIPNVRSWNTIRRRIKRP